MMDIDAKHEEVEDESIMRLPLHTPPQKKQYLGKFNHSNGGGSSKVLPKEEDEDSMMIKPKFDDNQRNSILPKMY
jgi:hypothetical protein